MALIQSQKAVGASSRRKYDERCIRKADPKIPVPANHLRGLLHVLNSEGLEPVGATCDLTEEEQFRGGPDSFQQQVVNFSGHEWREEERAWISFKRSRHIFMPVLSRVDKGEQTAGIENDQSPKPLSASSTRSARCGSPLRKRPGVGRGLSFAVRCSRASRINEASDRPRRRASRPRRRFNSGGR